MIANIDAFAAAETTARNRTSGMIKVRSRWTGCAGVAAGRGTLEGRSTLEGPGLLVVASWKREGCWSSLRLKGRGCWSSVRLKGRGCWSSQAGSVRAAGRRSA